MNLLFRKIEEDDPSLEIRKNYVPSCDISKVNYGVP